MIMTYNIKDITRIESKIRRGWVIWNIIDVIKCVIVNEEQRYAYHLLVIIYPHSLHPWHRSERSKSSKCTHCFECLDAPSTNKGSSKIDERNLDTKVIWLVVKLEDYTRRSRILYKWLDSRQKWIDSHWFSMW